MQNGLEKFCPKPASFHMDWVPGQGLVIKAKGTPVAVNLLTCFALMHASMGTLKAGKNNPAGALAMLMNALHAAKELYEDVEEMTVVDLKEVRKQAQDADKQ